MHCRFQESSKRGSQWLEFRKVETPNLMSKGNSVLVTAMFCKRCERSGFDRNERGKPLLWTGHAGHYDCSRLRPHFFICCFIEVTYDSSEVC